MFQRALPKLFETDCPVPTTRPAGWISLWRKLQAVSALDQKGISAIHPF
jgi:hypothetical protein